MKARAAAVALSFACACAGGRPGQIEGTVGGRKLQLRSALLLGNSLGELVVALSDVPFTCADVAARRTPPSYTGVLAFLADLRGAERVHPALPAHAGTFRVIHFLDYRAAWFQERGAAPRKGEGRRPADDGSYAAFLSHAGGRPPSEGGKGVNWPISASGQLTLDEPPRKAGELVSGSFDVVLESGEQLHGTFAAETCPEALAPGGK